MKSLLGPFLLLAVMTYDVITGIFTSNCMKCMCKIQGCESETGKCRNTTGTLNCGPYAITKPYYTDCSYGKPDWETCTKELACSETCVQSYMRRYAVRCDPNPTCETYARVHSGGPQGCRRNFSIGYWNKVNRCCTQAGGCDGPLSNVTGIHTTIVLNLNSSAIVKDLNSAAPCRALDFKVVVFLMASFTTVFILM